MDSSAPETVAFSICGSIARAKLPRLCECFCVLLEHSGADVAFCDVRDLDADAVTVDALARFQLAARRHGCQVRLRHTTSELSQLLAFMGLRDVLPD